MVDLEHLVKGTIGYKWNKAVTFDDYMALCQTLSAVKTTLIYSIDDSEAIVEDMHTLWELALELSMTAPMTK